MPTTNVRPLTGRPRARSAARHDPRRQSARKAHAGKRWVLAAVAAPIALLSGSTAGAAPKRDDCAGAGQTVVSTAKVRVYSTRPKGSLDNSYSACWLPTGRRVGLGSDVDEGETSVGLLDFRIAGRYLGFVVSSNVRETDQPVLVDVRAHQTVARPVVMSYDDGEMPGLTDLVVTAGGTMAWTGPGRKCVGLNGVDTTGATYTSCGAASALAANGRRLFWLDGDQTRTLVVRR